MENIYIYEKKEEYDNDKINDKDLNERKNVLINNNDKINEKELKENKINSINNRLEKCIEHLIKNKLDLIHNSKKHKKGNLYNNSNGNNTSNFILNTFNNDYFYYKNKLMKKIPLADKIMKDKAKGIILPTIKTPIKKENYNLNSNINNYYHFTKIPKESLVNNNISNEQKNEIFPYKKNIFRNIKLNRIININNDTQTTQSATNSIKIPNSSKNNIIPNLKEDMNKYERGLIPAGSTKNNNIIIPILSWKGVSGNFNGIYKNKKSDDKKDTFNCVSNNSRNKIFKNGELKGKINISMKNKEISKLFSDVQKLVPNFHKIKIDKGINNHQFINSYSKKISFDYKSKNQINFNNNLNVKSVDDY